VPVKSDGIRIAVVGVGYWGSRHARVLRSTTGVAAVAGIDERFSQIGNVTQGIDHGVTAYSCLEDALPHVDAVIIATPPASHARLGLQAIEAGKHVLIEKPMATTTGAARHLIDAAKSAGVLLMPGHTFEHNAAVHKLRELLSTGQLGRLFYLDCERLNLGLYQADVNVILDLAPHDISISNFVLGAQPTTVTAWASRHVHPEHEDVAYVRLDYADLGVRTTIHVSWLSPEKVRRVTAVGSQRMVVYNDMADGERIRVYDKAAVPPSEADGPLSQVAYHLGGIVSPFVAFAEPLAVQDQHFVDCIINGSAPSVDGSSGLAVVQALECAQISLREQRPVALAEVTQRHSAGLSVPGQTIAPGASVD
jgi:predicted dehydrogenase